MDSTRTQHHHQHPKKKKKHCAPLLTLTTTSTNPNNPFSILLFYFAKSLRALCFNRIHCCTHAFVITNTLIYASSSMEPVTTNEASQKGNKESFAHLIEDTDNKARESTSTPSSSSSSLSSEFLSSSTNAHDVEEQEKSPSSTEESSSSSVPSMGWPVKDIAALNLENQDGKNKKRLGNGEFEKQESVSEIEMMKERFAKLLLGEDMSGCGNGVPTALAISNAITNLCATLFGQLWRLEPLRPEKKAMWRREMEWLLSVSDHIVELIPTWQTFADGNKLEVMTCRPRSDLYVNLPALRKLDNMLLEILDSFVNTEFWYVDQGVLSPDADGVSSFRQALQRQEEKWWLPVPRVPPCGLNDNSRKQLQHKRDCSNQILKAAMAINSITLAEMDIPESYLESLPKNARVSLGDVIYRYITSDHFSPECLLACLDLTSEHQAIEIANRAEASMYIWRKRINTKPANNITTSGRTSSRTSWEMVKDLMVDGEAISIDLKNRDNLDSSNGGMKISQEISRPSVTDKNESKMDTKNTQIPSPTLVGDVKPSSSGNSTKIIRHSSSNKPTESKDKSLPSKLTDDGKSETKDLEEKTTSLPKSQSTGHNEPEFSDGKISASELTVSMKVKAEETVEANSPKPGSPSKNLPSRISQNTNLKGDLDHVSTIETKSSLQRAKNLPNTPSAGQPSQASASSVEVRSENTEAKAVSSIKQLQSKFSEDFNAQKNGPRTPVSETKIQTERTKALSQSKSTVVNSKEAMPTPAEAKATQVESSSLRSSLPDMEHLSALPKVSDRKKMFN